MNDTTSKEQTGKSILITASRRAERAQIKVRKRLHKVYFKLPKTGRKWWSFKPFDPRSTFVSRWKIWMLIPLCLEFWMLPFRISLTIPSSQSGMQIIFIELFVDIMCLADIIVQFCTIIPARHPKEERITTFLGIARHVFRTSYLLEILPAFPYWITFVAAKNQVQHQCAIHGNPYLVSWGCFVNDWAIELVWWWILSGVRALPRILRLLRDFHAIESNLVRMPIQIRIYLRRMIPLRQEVTVRSLQILKFSVMIFMSSHWVNLNVFTPFYVFYGENGV